MSGLNGEGEAAQSSWQRPDAPLGTLIFREGLLSAEQLEEALGESVKRGKRLGQVLVERGLLEESQVARILARQKGLEYVDLRETAVDPAAASLLSSEVAWLTHAVPIAVVDGTPFVAVEDPGDEESLRTVAEALGAQPRFAVATRSEILRVLGTVFEGGPAGAPVPAAPVLAQAAAPVVQLTPDSTPVVPLQQPAAPPPQPAVVEANGLRVAAPLPEQPAEVAPEPVAGLAPEPAVQVAPVPAPVEPEPIPAAPESVSAVESMPVAAAPDQAPPVQVWPEGETTPEPAPVEPAPAVEAAPPAEAQPVAFEQPAAPVEPPAATVEAQPEPTPAVQQPPAAGEVPEQAPAPAPPAPAFPEEPAPNVVDFPPTAPPAAEPPAASQPQAPEVAPPAFEPWPEPAPAAEALVTPEVAEPAGDALAGEHRVVATLADGSEIEVDVFPSPQEAKDAAKLLARQIGAAAPGEWPELGGRFVRPDLIVSVDLR
jgi:hypothetical protein